MHKKIYILLVSLLALMKLSGKSLIKDPEFGAKDYREHLRGRQ